MSSEDAKRHWKEYLEMKGAELVWNLYSKVEPEDLVKMVDLYLAGKAKNLSIKELSDNLQKVPWALNAMQVSKQLQREIESRKSQLREIDIEVGIKDLQRNKLLDDNDKLSHQRS